MAGERAAYRYAKAAFSLSKDEKATEAVNGDMATIYKTVDSHKDLKNMLYSPVVKSQDKKAVLFRVFTDLHKTTVNTIDVMITNNRIYLLADVAKRFTALYDEFKGTQTAKVTTAVPLSEELKVQVLTKVKELTAKEVEVENVVDPSIIGGFILRVGDVQYDASIANKLNKLKREFSLN
ncbi:ATP synthase F1 subcomplex delta subunit [Flavobacteriaceae bacterium MAR_2010_188]|nr:ATP synthase F1 subcomplex delta subunit [Flavobacteriaceae bacterium MAR_2010_188]